MMRFAKREVFKTASVEALPLAIAIAAYGVSYGVLATQVNFNVLTAVLMSVLVFSGSAQLVAVAMLAGGAGIASVLLTVVLLNLRNLLYGAALAEGLAPAKNGRACSRSASQTNRLYWQAAVLKKSVRIHFILQLWQEFFIWLGFLHH
ncbi:branched-chain amino acid transport protein AzlC [Sporolactobacillus inulinus]|uniref:Branched-chain amino acid transport protein AzlC n=1 Tax=Sporolactobacillus inulinus TaxID=2078 RepID=A0A4Y1ZG38_9BACL|nr:AzlC family ABC transporter permease [Sporolactobacillus inulinus]GAY78142.1 branched-chain amino acid transport protein AzlC [Sporolactobacillus inulinus]